MSPVATMRPLDHLVLPVEDLETTRARHAALGFTIAANAVHPFGTENACVFFADNTYLEPLAIASREDCEAAARGGNVFVARDQAFRFRRGDNGFSAIVTGSDGGDADHASFVAEGLSAGDMLSFSRPMTFPDGSTVTASFKLAFAADLRSPDFFGFTVERINVPPADRTALTTHANGVTGIIAAVLSEPNPSDFQYFLQELARTRNTDADSFGISVPLAGSRIDVLSDDGLAARFGIGGHCQAGGHSRGLRGRGVVFAVSSLAQVREVLAKSGTEYREHGGRVVVDKAAGQGAFYAFEETQP